MEINKENITAWLKDLQDSICQSLEAEDGIATHIRVTKRDGSLGLGAKKDMDGSAGWSNTAVNFASVLASLNQAYKPPKVKKSKRKRAALESDQQQQQQQASADPIQTSTAAAPAGISTLKQVCPSRARRVKAKDIRSFSSSDLKAIMGHAGSAFPVIATSSGSLQSTIISNNPETSSVIPDEKEVARQRKAAKAQRKAEKAAAKSLASSSSSSSETANSIQQQPTDAEITATDEQQSRKKKKRKSEADPVPLEPQAAPTDANDDAAAAKTTKAERKAAKAAEKARKLAAAVKPES